tara:strand:- start:133 stop:573 length:441 start_codon:yes stop_codon:yes gene_type:complete
MQNIDKLSKLFRGMTTPSYLKPPPRRMTTPSYLKPPPRRSARTSTIDNRQKVEKNIKKREEKVINKKRHKEDMKELLNQMSGLELELKKSKGKTKTLKNRKTKNRKTKKAVRSHDGRPVNKVATRVSKLRVGQFPRRKTKNRKIPK